MMNPNFPKTANALKLTLEFYNIWKIKNYFEWFNNPSAHTYLKDWVEAILYQHEKMEDEIQQTIHTTNANTQTFLFENLKEWLDDYRIKSVDPQFFLLLIDDYNEKAYKDFDLLVENAVEKFMQSPNFYREHLEEYEVESKPNALMGGLYAPFKKTKKINYKFYCITESPDLIDLAYLDRYLDLVNKIIGNFKRIVSKYVKLYDEGKIFESSSTRIAPAKPTKNYLSLLAESNENKKLKVNLTVPQLAFLFKLLDDTNLIKDTSNTDICNFISSNFTTKASGDISTKNLMNHFSTPDKVTADYWRDILNKMKTAANKA